jgi:hypothetical protein
VGFLLKLKAGVFLGVAYNSIREYVVESYDFVFGLCYDDDPIAGLNGAVAVGDDEVSVSYD